MTGYDGCQGTCVFPGARCCDDHQHCCPSEYPVCDVAQGTCTSGDGMRSVEIGTKTAAALSNFKRAVEPQA